jgi:hypothetical protein
MNMDAQGSNEGMMPDNGMMPNNDMQSGYGPQIGGGIDWRASLPPELQHVVRQYKDLPEFVKTFGSAQEIIGKKFDEFSQQDFQKYNAMMSAANGIPTSPEGYQIDPYPESGELRLSPEETEDVLRLSHSMGLDNERAQILHDALNNLTETAYNVRQNEEQVRYEGCMNDLAGAWGNAYESKIQAVESAVENVLPQLTGTDPDTIREELFDAGVYKSPVLMKMLAAVGELAGNAASSGYSALSPMDAQVRLNQMRSDPETMRIRINPHHPLHSQIKEEFATLCQTANNGR